MLVNARRLVVAALAVLCAATARGDSPEGAASAGATPSAAASSDPAPAAAASSAPAPAAAASSGPAPAASGGASGGDGKALPAMAEPPGPPRLRRFVSVGPSFVGSSAQIGPGASVRLTFREEDVLVTASLDEITGSRTIGLAAAGVTRPTRHGFSVVGQGLFGFDAAGRGGMGLHPAAGARIAAEWPVKRPRPVDTFDVAVTGITDLTRGRDIYGARLPIMTVWLTAAVGFELGR